MKNKTGMKLGYEDLLFDAGAVHQIDIHIAEAD